MLMRKAVLSTLLVLLVLGLFTVTGFAQETKDITVKADEEAVEVMREKGSDLYVNMGIYRGY